MKAQVIVYDNVLIKFYSIYLWQHVKILPKKNKWNGIQVEGIERIGNHKGQKCSIFLKHGEYKLL